MRAALLERSADWLAVNESLVASSSDWVDATFVSLLFDDDV
jgi:hypothetical protein